MPATAPRIKGFLRLRYTGASYSRKAAATEPELFDSRAVALLGYLTTRQESDVTYRKLTVVLLACGVMALGAACGDDDSGDNNNVNSNANDNGNANDNTNDNNNNVTIEPFTGTLDELDGYFDVTGATLRPSSQEIAITAENTTLSLPEFGGTTARVVGYADLASSSTTEGQLELRWGVIADANGYGDVGYYVEAFDFTASWEQAEGKLMLTDGADVGVYLVEFAAEVLTLHYDETDWRSNLDHVRMAKRMELTRTSPPAPGPLDAVWNTQSQTWNPGELNEFARLSVCSPLDPDDGVNGIAGEWTGTMTLGPSGWLIYDTLFETFDASDCTGTYQDHFSGRSYGFFALDSGAGTVDLYLYSPDGELNEFGETYGYTVDGTELTLTFMDYRDMVPNPYSGADVLVYTSAP